MTLLTLLALVLGLALWSRLSALSGEVSRLRERLERLEGAAAERAPSASPATATAQGQGEQLILPRAAPEASPASPWPEDRPRATGRPSPPPVPPRPPAPPRAPPSSRTVFAVLGAGVTLAGAAWFTAALARSGVLTREVQLALAAALAALLYAGAGRTAPVIGEALRGLGYGILALCLGALVGAGVAPPAAVLAALLALSLAVGLHGAVQGRLLGTATALAGASVSTWILADNLGDLLFPGLALLGILACTVLAERRLRPPGTALLALLPGAALLGLAVTATVHRQEGQPLLWAALLLAAVGAALAVGLRNGREDRDAPVLPARPVLAAGGILLAGLAGAPPLLAPLSGGLGPGLSTAALLLVGAVYAGLAVGLHRRGEGPNLRPLRDALLAVAVGTLGGALALGVDGWRLSTRLLGLASGVALLGTWLRSGPWRRVGAAGVILVLLDHLLSPWPSSAVVAGLGLGTAAALAGGAGAAVAGMAGAALVGTSLALPETAVLWPGLDPRFLAALGLALALHGAALGLERGGQPSRGRTVAWAAVAGSVLLVPVGLLLAGVPVQAAAHGLLAGAVLFLGPAGRLAGEFPRLRRGGLGVTLELLGVAAAVLGLLAWTLGGALRSDPLPPLALLLAALAVVAGWLPGGSRPFWRAWPVLSLAALVSLGFMLDIPSTAREGVLTLLGAGGTLAALWLLATPAGVRLLAGYPAGRGWRDTGRRVGAPLFAQGVLTALVLALLALMGRTAELLGRAGSPVSPGAPTLASTAVLLAASVMTLILARRQGLPVRWWVALAAFGLASLKLVFVDFGDLGGIARGAATVVIGLLLLGIGQLAPRPEAERAATPQDVSGEGVGD